MKTLLAVGAGVLAVIWMGNLHVAHRGTIVPQHGIDGARVGQTYAQVQRALGTPVHEIDRRNALGRYRLLRFPGVTVMLQGRGHVTKVWTRSGEHLALRARDHGARTAGDGLLPARRPGAEGHGAAGAGVSVAHRCWTASAR